MDLSVARLVTLSAGESGVSDVFESGEEFVGLPAGLLEAGAPAVLASLWPVDDVSTAFLMDRFYQLWLDPNKRLTIAEALHQAARWLRTATKAELLERIVASDLAPQDRELIQALLTKLTVQRGVRMSSTVGLGALTTIRIRAAARSMTTTKEDAI